MLFVFEPTRYNILYTTLPPVPRSPSAVESHRTQFDVVRT